MPITWKNVNAADQSDAARLLAGASQSLTSGFGQISKAAGDYQKRIEADATKLKAERAETDNNNTQNLLNTISRMNSTQLAEAKGSGAFTQEVLARAGHSADNIAKIYAAIDNQDNVIFANDQEDVQRKLLLQQQSDAQNARQRKITEQAKADKNTADTQILSNILRDRQYEGDPARTIDQIRSIASQNKMDIDVMNAAIKQALASDDDEAFLSANQKRERDETILKKDIGAEGVLQSYNNQIATLEGKIGKNPVKGSDEHAKQVTTLNKTIDALRQGDRWNPLAADVEEVKQEVMDIAGSLKASPAQAEAAFSMVIDGDGDYSSKEFKKQLKELVSNPEGDLAKQRLKQLKATRDRFMIENKISSIDLRKNLTKQFLEGS